LKTDPGLEKAGKPEHRIVHITRKNIFIASLGMAAIFILGASVYIGMFLRDTEKLGDVVEKQLQAYSGHPVSIGSLDMNLRHGLRANLNRIKMQYGRALTVEADSVTVYLSLWELLKGNSGIDRLSLNRPALVVNLNRFDPARASETVAFPPLEIHDGTINVIYQNQTIDLSNIDGSLTAETMQLTAILGEAPLKLLFKRSRNRWTCGAQLANYPLAAMTPHLDGNVDLDFLAEGDATATYLTVRAAARPLKLPGGGEPFSDLTVRINAVADSDAVTINELAVVAPFATISGQGKLDQGLAAVSMDSTNLEFSLSSDEIDFETLVRHLPFDSLPDWLTVLVGTQIRNGRLRLNTVAYKGPLTDFNANGDFFEALKVTADLNEMSFGAGHSPERVDGINLLAGCKSGGLFFTNLTGKAGASQLGPIDLLFPDLLEPNLRVIAKADVDMPAVDFVHGWRAVMWPAEGHRLLDPLTEVRAGRVKGQVVFQDQIGGKGYEVTGSAELKGADLIWDSRKLQAIDCRASVEQFGAPINLVLNGIVNDFPINRLELTLSDPFTQPTYQYQLATDQLPEMDAFKLGSHAKLVAAGTGGDCAFNGTVQLSTDDFKLMGTPYASLGAPITAAGGLRGSLCPQFSLDLTDVSVQMPGGGLQLALSLEEASGTVTVKGKINTAETADAGPDLTRPLTGNVDLRLAWSDIKPLAGSFHFKDMVTSFKDEHTIVNGHLQLANHVLSSRDTAIVRGTSTYTIAGTLTTEDPKQFKGLIAINGLEMRKSTSKAKLPAGLSASADITLADSTVYGIRVEQGTAHVELAGERLQIERIDVHGPEAALAGNITFDDETNDHIDLNFDLKNGAVTGLLDALYPDKELLDGQLHVSGDLLGPLQSLDGRIAVKARDGHTMKSSVLTKILGVLNVYKIMKSGGLDLGGERFAYNKLSADLTIDDSVVHFKNLYLDSDSIQLSAVGKYTINTNLIDAIVGVQPLESIDKAVNVIPLLGWVLTGDDDKLFVITMKVMGTTEDPDIRLTPGSTLSQPVADTLLRILKLPETIVSRPKDLILEKKDTEP
jgi:hypothetical protein